MTRGSTISPEVAAVTWEEHGRNAAAAARALGIGAETLRRRLADYYGSWQAIPAKPLRSSSAALGRKFEHRVRDALTAAGWWVIRAAGSKGEADLVGIRSESERWCPEVVLVSAKRSATVGVDEWNWLYSCAVGVRATAAVAQMQKEGGIAWHKIDGPKTGERGKRQPWTSWAP